MARRSAATGWILVGLLGGAAWAQDPAPASTEAPQGPSTPESTAEGPAFDLQVDAPEELKTLLQRHLALQRYRQVPDLGEAELDRLLVEAQKDATQLLATQGFFAPTVTLERSGQGRATRVTVKIEPGPAAVVRALQIGWAGAVAADAGSAGLRRSIEAAWPLPVGQRFTQAQWDAAKDRALRSLSQDRYAAARIGHSQALVDADNASVQLELTLDSGPAYRLGPVRVAGNTRFDVALIEGLAQIEPGSDYLAARLQQAQQRLAASGYFDTAFVSLDLQGPPEAAPVLVQVHEAPMQKLVLGIGASTDSGARLSAEHTYRRLPLLPWSATTKLGLDRSTRSLGTDVLSPPDEAAWRWTGSMALQYQQLGSFDVYSQRWRLGRLHLGEQVDHQYWAQFERAYTAAQDVQDPQIVQTLGGYYALTLRRFDSVPFPSSGWGLGLEVGGGTTLDHQHNPFARLQARLQAFLPLGDAAAGRLSTRLQAGAVLADDAVTVPSTQMFLAGGDTSVRGYTRWSIGVDLPDGQTTAGRYLAAGTLEWQRPIYRDGVATAWESAVFVDSGAVANQPGALRAQTGVGFGARWKSPLGPLQLALAHGLSSRRTLLHLNVGFVF